MDTAAKIRLREIIQRSINYKLSLPDLRIPDVDVGSLWPEISFTKEFDDNEDAPFPTIVVRFQDDQVFISIRSTGYIDSWASIRYASGSIYDIATKVIGIVDKFLADSNLDLGKGDSDAT